MTKKLTYYQEGKILWDWFKKYGQHLQLQDNRMVSENKQ